MLTIVIGDIHGMAAKLQNLLGQIELWHQANARAERRQLRAAHRHSAAIRSSVATCSSSRTRQRSRRLSLSPFMLPRGRPPFFAFSLLALSLASVMGLRWRMTGTEAGALEFIGFLCLFSH
jgi:hypothetical protein